MGEQHVTDHIDPEGRRRFMRSLLDDIEALQRLIIGGGIESGIRRVGAELEMFLIDRSRQPAPIAVELLKKLENDSRLTNELARFNLEANLSPQDYGGDCLRKMEEELNLLVNDARQLAAKKNANIVLTGILPTIRRADLGLDRMTPMPRYFALNRAMQRMRGKDFHILNEPYERRDYFELTSKLLKSLG
mgnify:CR=1 FL=1